MILHSPILTTWSLFFFKVSNLQLMITQNLLQLFYRSYLKEVATTLNSKQLPSSFSHLYNLCIINTVCLRADSVQIQLLSQRNEHGEKLYVKPFIVVKKMSFNHKK